MEYEIWKHGLRDMEVGNYGPWYIDIQGICGQICGVH